MNNLLPCPFCGSDAASTSENNSLTLWAAYCLDCNAEVCDLPTESAAVAAWNLRAPSSPARELTDPDIDRLWNELDGIKIITGENQLNWNAKLRVALARAIERHITGKDES